MALAVIALAACTTGRPTTPTTLSSTASTPATTSSSAAAPPPVGAGSDYLALGDSVSFGYREPDTRPAPDYARASDFVGYPEIVARRLHLHLANAACPGETSSSLVDEAGPSFGCERGSDGDASGGYRTHYPLHVRYRGAQLAYGVHYLRTHPTTRLVTLMIGANDAFRCAERTSDHCTSEIAGVLSHVTSNVRTIMTALRGRAHYGGRIVLVTYYASDYGGLVAAASSTLDAAMTAGTRGFDVMVADGFAAFERAARASGGDSCKAGLLTRLTSGGCGVHPSADGQQLLADAIQRAVGR